MDRGLFFAICLLGFRASLASRSYCGYQVVRFYPECEEHLTSLHQLDRNRYDVWQESAGVTSPCDVMLSPEQAESLADSSLGSIPHDVIIKDLQILIDAAQPDGVNHDIKIKVDTDRFYNYSEIDSWMDQEAATCQYCQVTTYGRSWEGRNLKVMNISRPGSQKRAVWIDALAHAREWLTSAVSTCFINKLLYEYGTDTEVTELLDKYDWYIVPLVNPDGYEYTWTSDRMWRKTRSPNQNINCSGTDGNRNYDYQWNGGDPEECSVIYHGSSAESESEIANITDYVEGLAADIDLMFSFHTYSQIMLRPWGYTETDPPDVIELDRLGNIGVNAINANSNVTYTYGRGNGVLFGSSFDWSYGAANITHSYTIELRDKGTYGFIAPPEEIQPTCNEVWAGVHAMAMDLASP